MQGNCKIDMHRVTGSTALGSSGTRPEPCSFQEHGADGTDGMARACPETQGQVFWTLDTCKLTPAL